MRKNAITLLMACMGVLTWSACNAQNRPNTPAIPLTASQLEAKRKCPDGPYDRCGELVGPYADVVFQPGNQKILGKDMPPHVCTFGGVRYKIPYSFARVMHPQCARADQPHLDVSAETVAFWIPLGFMANGTEAAGTKLARESMKLGLMWPFGVRIHIKTNVSSLHQRSTYTTCKPNHIDVDAQPTKMSFDMTQYVDRSIKAKLVADTLCYVSDDPKYEFFKGIPVTYFVRPSSRRGGSTSNPYEVRAEAAFTLHNDKVLVEYWFQTDMLPYWKEIHTAVLKLVQSWEQ
jgi:hypothetical protein